MKGFYFGSTFINRDSLRASLLYYDSIAHYDVKAFFEKFYNTNGKIKDVIDEFERDNQILRQEGVLELIDLNTWVHKYGETFKSLSNSEFLKHSPMLYRLLNSSEAPRLIVLYSYGKIVSALPLEPVENSICNGKVSTDSQNYFSKWGKQDIYYCEKDALSFKPDCHYGFDLKEYVKISIGREVAYGLLGSVEFDAVPLTDCGTYAKFLEYILYNLVGDKINGIYSGVTPHPLPEKLSKCGAPNNILEYVKDLITQKYATRNMIVEEFARIELPAFENLPDEELLKIRDQCHSSIDAFREEVDTLQTFIEEEDDDAKIIKKKVRETIRTKLSPKVSDLKKAISEQADEIRRKRVANLACTAATMSGYYFLPFEVLILPFLILEGKLISDELNYFFDNLHRRKHSMYFTIQLNRGPTNKKRQSTK